MPKEDPQKKSPDEKLKKKPSPSENPDEERRDSQEADPDILFVFEEEDGEEEEENLSFDDLYDQDFLRLRANNLLADRPETQKTLSALEYLAPLNVATAEVLAQHCPADTPARAEALDIMIAATLIADADDVDDLLSTLDLRVDALREEFMLLYAAETQDDRVGIMEDYFSTAAKKMMLASIVAECQEISYLVMTGVADPLNADDVQSLGQLVVKVSTLTKIDPLLLEKTVDAFNSLTAGSGHTSRIQRAPNGSLTLKTGFSGLNGGFDGDFFTPPSL